MSKFFNIASRILVFVFFGIVVFAILFSYFGPKPQSQIQNNTAEYKILSYNFAADFQKNGVMNVTETIDVEFNKTKHGIFRALPTVSTMVLENDAQKINKNFRLKYNLIGCGGEEFTTETEDGFFYIILGDYFVSYPAGTQKTYQISYNISIDERYFQYDVFYFNVLGALTDTTIANFTASIRFEEQIETPNTHIYSGTTGQKTELETYFWSTDGKELNISAQNIGVGEAITVLADLPDNYSTVIPNHTIDIIMLVGLIVLALLFVWLYFKHSNKTIITPVVQFTANKNYTSADVGYIIDKTVNTADIASLIIYWAQKGFLKILCEGKKTFLIKTDKEFSGKIYEKELFGAIFAGKTEGQKIDIGKIGLSISESIAVTKKSIAIENESLFNKNAVALRGLMAVFVAIGVAAALIFVNAQNVQEGFGVISLILGIGIGVFLFALGSFADKKYTQKKTNKFLNRLSFFLFLATTLFVCVVSYDAYCDPFATVFLAFGLLVLASVLVLKLNVRTDDGCRELGDILGLKNFIEVAEKSRLEALVKDDPQMFYQILPYAYVLGVYDDWCKRFEGIDIGVPSFYEGTMPDVFDIIWFSHIISITTDSMLHSINTANLAKTAESIGQNIGGFSGGSGGGFSGGGLGGGGVGSW